MEPCFDDSLLLLVCSIYHQTFPLDLSAFVVRTFLQQNIFPPQQQLPQQHISKSFIA